MNCKIVGQLGPKYSSKWPKVGKSAIITGASSGLGKELAILFSQDGHVILSGRDANKLEATRLLCKDPHNTTLVCGDLQHISTQDRLVHFADLFAIRYLICCAGQYKRGKLREHTCDGIISLLNSNLTSTISLIHAVYPHLLDENSTIVHINSTAGKSIQSDELVYSASKHGMRAFLQGLRFEAREKGIRVLDVFPGAIQTPMNANSDTFSRMMDVKETAKVIYAAVTPPGSSLQLEELHIGRFRQK